MNKELKAFNKEFSSKSNKFRNFIWTIVGIILMAGVIIATTTITDNSVTSPSGDYTNITADRINEVYYFDELDCTNNDCTDNIKTFLEGIKENSTIIFSSGIYNVSGKAYAGGGHGEWGSIKINKTLHIRAYGATFIGTQKATESDEYIVNIENAEYSTWYGGKFIFEGSSSGGGAFWIRHGSDNVIINDVDIKRPSGIDFGSYGFYIQNISNTRISDFVVDNIGGRAITWDSNPLNESENLLIENCIIKNSAVASRYENTNMIFNNIQIKNCVLKNNTHGFLFGYVDNVLVDGLLIENGNGHTQLAISARSKNIIFNNIIIRNTNSTVDGDGAIKIYKANHTIISNVIMENIIGKGIHLATSENSHIKIDNAQMFNISSDAIRIYGTPDNIKISNIISDKTSYANFLGISSGPPTNFYVRDLVLNGVIYDFVEGDVNIDVNVTIGDKITFAFGQIIDNLVDGWLRITGNLEVTGNVTAPQINSVLYVQAGNGSDLENVLENQCSNGCSVKVPKGRYDIESSIQLNNVGNITINLDDNAIINATIYNPIEIRNFSNIKIIGGKWRGDTGINIKGIVFICQQDNCENIIIKDTVWDSNIYRPIQISAEPTTSKISQIILENNQFTQFDRAIDINSEPASDFGTVSNILITDNKFSRKGSATIAITGVNIARNGTLSEIIITDNIFKNIQADNEVIGIHIRGGISNTSVNNILISNNIFKNLTTDGDNNAVAVRVAPANRILFNNNICEDIGYFGSANRESHCFWAFESPDINEGSQVIVSNNIIKNIFTGSTGVDKDDSEGIYCKATNCIITGNNLVDGGDSRAIAIKGNAEFAKNAIVSNNIIEYVERTPYCGGIRIEHSNATIIGNIISNISVPAFEFGGLESLGYITLENNQVYGAESGVGEKCGSVVASDFISIRNNLFQGITTIDVNVSVTENFDRVVISGNYGFQNQTNTTYVSPDGTEFTCGVNDSGSFLCS